nr:coiled-coil domain-containing protein 12 isoform X2 [Geotrypetes seraphini]
MPQAKPASVEEKVKDQLEAAKLAPVIEEVDLANLAPRKPDWDLKRDVAKKLEKLEKRTQKAIAELINYKDVIYKSLPYMYVLMKWRSVQIMFFKVQHEPPEDFTTKIENLKKQMENFKADIRKNKIGKLQRDEDDYIRGLVYPWMDRNRCLRQPKKVTYAQTSSSLGGEDQTSGDSSSSTALGPITTRSAMTNFQGPASSRGAGTRTTRGKRPQRP